MRLSNGLNVIIPWLESARANDTIAKKIAVIESTDLSNLPLDYMKGYDELTLDEVNSFFDKTIDVKKSLEEKLKTSLFSVTVGVTVLTSATTFLFNEMAWSLNPVVRIIVFLSAAVAVIYMLMSAVSAIKTISGKIVVYQVFPEDLTASENIKKKRLAQCTELNSLTNIIRQNLMNTSFRCIINALFVTAMFFCAIGTSSFLTRPRQADTGALRIEIQASKEMVLKLKDDLREFEQKQNDNLRSISEDMRSTRKALETMSSKHMRIDKQNRQLKK